MRFFKSLFSLIVLASLLVTPPQTLAQDTPTCQEEVVVQAGDWLSKLADKYYGDPLAYDQIVVATNAKAAEDDSFSAIDDANLIEIGWKLCLPAIDAEVKADMIEADTSADIAPPLPGAEEISARVKLYESVAPFPVLSVSYPDLSLSTAYDVQADYVAGLVATGHERWGYKLGLTGEQKPFGATESVYGVLFRNMEQANGAVIQSTDFVQPMIEVELAFIFAQDVSYPTSAEALQASVATVAPAVELPDLVYTDMSNLTWLDLIADNVAPRQLILGEGMPLEGLDVDRIETVATRDGEVINEAPATASMGGQWNALLFLAEKLNEQEQSITAGDVVITGALGPMLPGQPGAYQVDYGVLGEVTFTLE